MKRRIFQFTPLREGRPGIVTLRGITNDFNSRPSARGDRRGRLPLQKLLNFKSRPSARGDYPEHLHCAGGFDFNSRPSARGDLPLCAVTRPTQIFQFTPLREGRRRKERCRTSRFWISIHAPPRGATCWEHTTHFTPRDFNSRPSARGDRKIKVIDDPNELFQFTPLREGRQYIVSCKWFPENFNSRPSARGDGKRYAISANLLFNPYKSAWLNNSATQFVEIILVIFHRIIA